MPTPYQILLERVAGWFKRRENMAAVSVRVDDSPGWGSLTHRPHDYDPAQILENYGDALTAWRKNPIAWRIIAITCDYVLGDGLVAGSQREELDTFIQKFWHHPQNHMPTRLESLVEELSRSGDLFVLLFRNDQDGMSYIRTVTKDQIVRIESNPEDWEQELIYHERLPDSAATRPWLSPQHPDASNQPAVMLHYAVNRPAGALLGESDLVTMAPWLQRYSQMLEDRTRLHWAMRAFLYIVTVPTSRVAEKRAQYLTPPESGSIIVKDEGETWEAVTPTLHGADAQHDLKAVRNMIDAGSGYPPHWRGEPEGSNLATAQAMQSPTERHLKRRQLYVSYMLQDILLTAYKRAAELPNTQYHAIRTTHQDIEIKCPDISRADNVELASAAQSIAQAAATISQALPGAPKSLRPILLDLFLKAAGSTAPTEALEAILAELEQMPRQSPRPQPAPDGAEPAPVPGTGAARRTPAPSEDEEPA